MLVKVQSVPRLLIMILWMHFNVKIGPDSDETTTMMGFQCIVHNKLQHLNCHRYVTVFQLVLSIESRPSKIMILDVINYTLMQYELNLKHMSHHFHYYSFKIFLRF